MLKCLIISLLTLLIIPLAYSANLQECSRQLQPPSEIPCAVFSTWKPSNCTEVNVTIYNETNNLIENLTWSALPTKCTFNFTHRDKQTYIWNSSIDTGVIVVEEETMLSIIVMMIGVFAFFMILGFINKIWLLKITSYLLAIYQIIMMAGIVYLNEMGDSITGILRTNFFITLILGIMLIFGTLIALSLRVFEIHKPVEDLNKDPKWVK